MGKLLKKEIGITLIALVVTIIVLIILAVVTINITFGENGLFNTAIIARQHQLNAEKYDQEIVLGVDDDKIKEMTSTYKVYKQGEEVTIGTTEKFYVIEDSESDNKKVKLLAVKNIETESTPYIQTDNASKVIGFINYSNSDMKNMIDTYVSETLNFTLDSNEDARLLGYNDMPSVGAQRYIDGNGFRAYRPGENMVAFARDLDYWLGFGDAEEPIVSGGRGRCLAYNDPENSTSFVSELVIEKNNTITSNKHGLRPVIEIYKWRIEN